MWDVALQNYADNGLFLTTDPFLWDAHGALLAKFSGPVAGNIFLVLKEKQFVHPASASRAPSALQGTESPARCRQG